MHQTHHPNTSNPPQRKIKNDNALSHWFNLIKCFSYHFSNTLNSESRQAITIILENPFDTSDPNCIDVFQLQLGFLGGNCKVVRGILRTQIKFIHEA